MTKDQQARQAAKMYQGDDAFDEFHNAVNALLQDGARGEIILLVREGCNLRSRTVSPMSLGMGLPLGCEMVIIDGESPDGEAWKTTYYMEQGICTVVQESELELLAA